MPRSPPTLLTLPVELRLEIYTHLLVLPPPPPLETQQTICRCSYSSSPPQTPSQPDNKPRLYPQILAANTQTNHEATPILYTHNTFAAHPVHLTASPTLYHPYYSHNKPVPTTNPPNQITPKNEIKKWRLRLRLDSIPQWDKPTIAAAFSHAHELTLDVWSGTFMGGVGADVLRQFEGVRGVRRARVRGSIPGFEGYVGWLVKRMMRTTPGSSTTNTGGEGDGCEGGGCEEGDEEYVPGDETERRRLSGWV